MYGGSHPENSSSVHFPGRNYGITGKKMKAYIVPEGLFIKIQEGSN